MLTGTELLAKVKDLGDMSKSDLVRSAGYVSTKKADPAVSSVFSPRCSSTAT
jgi:hypothetical protein